MSINPVDYGPQNPAEEFRLALSVAVRECPFPLRIASQFRGYPRALTSCSLFLPTSTRLLIHRTSELAPKLRVRWVIGRGAFVEFENCSVHPDHPDPVLVPRPRQGRR